MRLADDDIRDLLARAEEIDRSLNGDAMRAELELVMQAAEEVGISRSAIERALRERLDLPHLAPTVGDLVFAQSVNGKFYAAEIVAAKPDGMHVRYLSGGEDTVTLEQLRACSFRPGERVAVQWPWWGACTCTVVRYDAAAQRVTVDDGWGETRAFPIAEVWLAAPRRSPFGRTRARMHATLIGVGALLGAIFGSIITALVVG